MDDFRVASVPPTDPYREHEPAEDYYAPSDPSDEPE